MNADFNCGRIDALDGRQRMERASDDYHQGYDDVLDVRAKLDSGEYKPSDIRHCIDPGISGGGPWDARAYRAGYEDAENRRPYQYGQAHEYGTGYSNRLLEETFRATDCGAAEMTNEALGHWEEEAEEKRHGKED